MMFENLEKALNNAGFNKLSHYDDVVKFITFKKDKLTIGIQYKFKSFRITYSGGDFIAESKYFSSKKREYHFWNELPNDLHEEAMRVYKCVKNDFTC